MNDLAVRLEDVGAAQRQHPVFQHPARGGVDDTMPVSGFVTPAAGDQVTARLNKEIGPFFEPVFVDALGIGGDQLVDAEPHRGVIHDAPRSACQSPTSARYFFQNPRIAASLERNGWVWAS